MFGTRKRICGPPWTGPTRRKEGEGIFCCNFRAAKAQDTCEKIDHISQAQEDYRIMRILLVQCHENWGVTLGPEVVLVIQIKP